MAQAMDHEAVDGDMDEEAEGAMDGASDKRSDRWLKRWITKQSKEIWMRKLKERCMVQAMDGASDGVVQAMDHEAVEGDVWIRKLSKERWMVQAMEGAIDGTSDGSRNSRRRYG